MAETYLKKFGPLLVLGIAGAIAFTLLLHDVTPMSSIDLRYSRPEIMEKASAYMERLGYNISDLHQDAWVGFDSQTQIYLQVMKGMKSANEILRADTIPAHHWYVSWFNSSLPRSQSKETFRMWISPSGAVLGYDHVIGDSVALQSLDGAEALTRAEAFLRSQGVDLSRYNLRNSSDIRQTNRTDHRFLWGDRDSVGSATIWVRVQGNEIGGYRNTFAPPESFNSNYSQIATTWTLVAAGSIAITFLLFFYIIILFLRKYHEGEVGTKTALMVFAGLLATVFLLCLNGLPIYGAGTQIGDLNQFNVRIVVFVMNVLIIQMFISVMVFAAWSVGESSSRTAWPEKMKAMDAALARRFFTFEVGQGLVRGYLWGLFLIGAYAVIVFLLVRDRTVVLHLMGISGIPESTITAVQPILYGIVSSVRGEVIHRFFFLSFLKEKTRRIWPGIVVSTAVWTGTGLTLWEIPFGQPGYVATVATLIGFGLCFSFLFLKYDLMTAITANFVVSSLQCAIPIFVSTGDAFIAVRWVTLGLLAVPFVIGIVGLIRRQRFEFTTETMPEHVRRISARERMAKELEIARNVQMSLLPKSNPQIPGFDIAGICVPALEVGGDYYDFVNLAGKRIGIAIGDVSGKGVPAAIYMTLTKGILQSHAEGNVSPKSVLSKVNSLMYRTIERNSFVSMFYAILDVQSRTIRFARAGQCPAILTQRAGDDGAFLTPKGMALGLEMGRVFDSVLEELEIQLQHGEVLVFYTDGFTEARDEHGEEFGEKRLVTSVARHRDKGAGDLIQGICADVGSFVGGTPQHDDMTMVVVKVN
jgi:hypothetical protein